MNVIAPYAKAVTAALVAGLGALATALDDSAVSAQEGVTVAIALLVALGAVWAVPNRPSEPEPEAPVPPTTKVSSTRTRK